MVFEEGNVLALEECLKQLLRSPDLRNDLSQKARKVTEQYFSWDKIALDLKTLYGSLLNEMPVNKGEHLH
jgi:glycosyltransferase involved in cell wall biosynthesis